MFRGCKQEDMPPHIFASVQTAYRNMLATRMDQSIVFMGLSGSGKTVNSKHVMHYLTSAACSHNSALTGFQILLHTCISFNEDDETVKFLN